MYNNDKLRPKTETTIICVIGFGTKTQQLLIYGPFDNSPNKTIPDLLYIKAFGHFLLLLFLSRTFPRVETAVVSQPCPHCLISVSHLLFCFFLLLQHHTLPTSTSGLSSSPLAGLLLPPDTLCRLNIAQLYSRACMNAALCFSK